MFKVFANAWRVKELRKKIIYTLMIMAIVRLGAHIPLPGLNLLDFTNQSQSSNLLLQIMSGGAGSRLSVFTMGIGPYISSSIIMQLLTIAIPKLEQMQKEGEEGRKKLQEYGRYMTILLALIQASALTYSMKSGFLPIAQNMYFYVLTVLTMIAGTSLVMWLAEAITKNGVGNGSSMIIFINIVSALPTAVFGIYRMLFDPKVNIGSLGLNEMNEVIYLEPKLYPLGFVIVLSMLFIFLVVIAFAILIQEGERRIPVQYSKKMVGRRMYGGQSSYIPIKVNTAGVISIIFAVNLLQFPEVVGQFIPSSQQTGSVLYRLIAALKQNTITGASLYLILIILFTFFYTSIVVNPQEMADNMKKNGGFIPGIRPGQPTSNYIKSVLDRITVVGGVSYALIAFIPIVLEFVFKVLGISGALGFGGTTVLIVVGVALDTVKALESQLLMRHYKGFLNE